MMGWPRRVLEEEEEEEVVMEEGEVRSWESFLPMASLRVLLVEGDDSTRHIISALLRKCNYKVAAVSDGLKGWEILKENPQGIDLVLAEVGAPAVSGLDLLSMITDHETCKNIPVIIMSSHHSISVVYKCMLKGAADFLVKPVRRNELRNLWQHVWRRNSSTDIHAGKSFHQDGNLIKRKHENLSEKEKNLSGYAPSTKKHKGCSEKASEAESSCTRTEMEAENTCRQMRKEDKQSVFKDSIGQNVEDQIQLIGSSLVHESQAESNDSRSATMLSSEVKSFNVKSMSNERSFALIETSNEDPKPTESVDNNDIDSYQDTPTIEAIDLIGTMENHLENGFRISNEYVSCKSSSRPLLELSLRGYQHSSFEEERGECSTLNHSDSSAFSQYNGRTAVSTRLTPMTFRTVGEECFSTNTRFVSDQGYGNSSTAPRWYDADVRFPTNNGKAIKCSPLRVVPLPAPERAMNFDNSSSLYGQSMAPMLYLQPIVGPSWNNVTSMWQQVVDKSSLRDDRDEQVHVLSVGDGGSGSMCNSTQDQLNNNGNTSNATNSCNASMDVENGVKMVGGIYRSSQREDALNKFRMKRKDRCFQKKVRYQSRKNLAEQRPRVKGQFVRHVQHNPAPTKV